MSERFEPDDLWSDPMMLAELVDREPRADVEVVSRPPSIDGDELDLSRDPLDDDLLLGDDRPAPSTAGRLVVMQELPDVPPAPSSSDGRDFARQLRAKMSQMAQRLFQGVDAPAPKAADLAPRHDHSTEIDLAALDKDLPLGGGVTEIEARAAVRPPAAPELPTSPGSWDTQIRERGVPESGEIARGSSDAAMLLAKMFANNTTGRIAFRRDGVEKVVFFDQGRPVFASSSEARDRMGELLVREGKITAAQYERCQAVVAESGRRMGEILVDFGYLKRRELLPAVRRHVEDIVYSLFGWDRGHYAITVEQVPSAERIRLSRHPAALVLEGIRRKLDRSTLERLIGPPSTVIEVADRERLGGIIHLGDLAGEERAALAALDGQADLLAVARTAGVDVADVLPLAWGLCVLGLATARRTETEVHEEGTALVGETDLAIDRERVRARWQLVTEADYFALLGVRRDATAFEIRRAYQAARRDFAVDSFPGDLRRELAQELDDIANVLDEAFRVLRDDQLRSTYLSHLID
ncbi:MAG: J domain-containing protein [Kofleriaceae bacterium]